jgi:hypothetical protein
VYIHNTIPVANVPQISFTTVTRHLHLVAFKSDVCDFATFEIPAAILRRIVDFSLTKEYERNTIRCLHFVLNI